MESRCVLKMSAFIDLKGRRFGRLLVMQATSKRSSQGDIYWKCVCDCGKSVVVNGKSLRSSGQKSCGCLQREWADSQHNRRTHDGSKDRLFRVWRGMIDVYKRQVECHEWIQHKAIILSFMVGYYCLMCN